MESENPPPAYYDPSVPGLQEPRTQRWIKYGQNLFCPIVLGHVVNDRYRIISLLGFGGDGMVWLAIDEPSPCVRVNPFQPSSPKYVALKVARGGDKVGNEELTLRLLMQIRNDDLDGGRNIIKLFDAFDIESASGIHRCLVLELAAGSLVDIKPHDEFTFDQHLVMFKECVQAVAHLHSQGLVHGDLDLANFLLAAPDFSALSETQVIAKLEFNPRHESNRRPVKMRDGSPLLPGVPTTLSSPGVFFTPKLLLPKLQIKLINFGEAFTGTKLGANVRIPRASRAPEIRDDEEASWEADIWALGCLFWELVFGQPFIESLEQEMGYTLEEFVEFDYGSREAIFQDLVSSCWPEMAEYEDEEEMQAYVVGAVVKMLEPCDFQRPKAEDILGFDLFRYSRGTEREGDDEEVEGGEMDEWDEEGGEMDV